MYYDTPLNFLWNKPSNLDHCVFRQGFWLENVSELGVSQHHHQNLGGFFLEKKAWFSFFTTPNLEGLSWIPPLEKKKSKKNTQTSLGEKISVTPPGLRLRPPVYNLISREAAVDTELDGVAVPKGTGTLDGDIFGGEVWGPLVALYRLKVRCLKQEA